MNAPFAYGVSCSGRMRTRKTSSRESSTATWTLLSHEMGSWPSRERTACVTARERARALALVTLMLRATVRSACCSSSGHWMSARCRSSLTVSAFTGSSAAEAATPPAGIKGGACGRSTSSSMSSASCDRERVFMA